MNTRCRSMALIKSSLQTPQASSVNGLLVPRRKVAEGESVKVSGRGQVGASVPAES